MVKILLAKLPEMYPHEKWNENMYCTLIAMRKDRVEGVENRIVLFKDGFSEIARTNNNFIKEVCIELKEVR